MRQLTHGVVLAAMVGLSTAAHAGICFTPVNEPPKPEEMNHGEILSFIYGGEFLRSDVNYSNGTITATRVVDCGQGGPLDLCFGNPEVPDQIWAGGPATVIARAKYAGDNSVFGWRDDTSGGAFQPLMNTASLDVPVEFGGSPQFRWALNDLRTGRHFTSRESDNLVDPGDEASGTRDQMVTYKITGLNSNECVWLLCWEDRMEGQAFDDYDFNDAVIEVRAIPAPGPLALIGAGLLLASRRRRS